MVRVVVEIVCEHGIAQPDCKDCRIHAMEGNVQALLSILASRNAAAVFDPRGADADLALARAWLRKLPESSWMAKDALLIHLGALERQLIAAACEIEALKAIRDRRGVEMKP